MRRVSWLLLLLTCCVTLISAQLLQDQDIQDTRGDGLGNRTHKAMFRYWDNANVEKTALQQREDQGVINEEPSTRNVPEQVAYRHVDEERIKGDVQVKNDREAAFEENNDNVEGKGDHATELEEQDTEGGQQYWDHRVDQEIVEQESALKDKRKDLARQGIHETVYKDVNNERVQIKEDQDNVGVQNTGVQKEQDIGDAWDKRVNSEEGNVEMQNKGVNSEQDNEDNQDEGVNIEHDNGHEHGKEVKEESNKRDCHVRGEQDDGDVGGKGVKGEQDTDNVHGQGYGDSVDVYVLSARHDCKESNSALECLKYLALDYLHRMAAESTKSTQLWGPISIIRTPPSTSSAEETTMAELEPRVTDSTLQQVYKFVRRQLEGYASTHALAWITEDEATDTARAKRGKGIHGKRTAQIALPLIALILFKLKVIAVMMMMILMCIKQFMMFASIMMPLMSRVNFFGRPQPGDLQLQQQQQQPLAPNSPNGQPDGAGGGFQGYPYSYMRQQTSPQQYRTIIQSNDYLGGSPYDSGQRAALRSRP